MKQTGTALQVWLSKEQAAVIRAAAASEMRSVSGYLKTIILPVIIAVDSQDSDAPQA